MSQVFVTCFDNPKVREELERLGYKIFKAHRNLTTIYPLPRMSPKVPALTKTKDRGPVKNTGKGKRRKY